MNNIQAILKVGIIALFLLIGSTEYSYSQKNKKSSIEITIVDLKGDPIANAEVFSSKNRYSYTTDASGRVRVLTVDGDNLKVKANGFSTKTFTTDEAKAGKIAIEPTVAHMGEDDIINLPFRTISERRSVGAYSSLSGTELEKNPTMFLENALGGRLNGLFTQDNTLVPGFTSSSNFVRSKQGNLLILIDGVERTMDYLEPEMIESVQLLKDASMKALYGGMDVSGILMITTKRGRPYENSVKVNFQTGVQMPTRLPKYLNSYDYAVKYNEAMVNSGYDPYYANPELYRNGSDPILYPDVDYYEQFLNKSMNITRGSIQVTGGSKTTSYYAHMGYQTNGGLEKYTTTPNRDDVFTVRANVDNKIKDFITFKAGFNAAIQTKKWPNMSTQNFFNMLSNNRPNEFPILIPGERLGIDKDFVLGGTSVNSNNPYGYLTQNGTADRSYTYIQSDFSINIDLDKWVKGFSIRPGVSLDVYNSVSSSQGAKFQVFEPYAIDGQENLGYYKWGETSRETSKTLSANNTNRNFVVNTVANYDRTFGKHTISAVANFFMQNKEFSAIHQKLKRINLGVAANYMYNNKYIVDASANYIGVGSFAPGNRFGLFPTVGAGWVLSEENFLKDNVEWIDYLKVRVSYGMTGSTTYSSDGVFNSYLYMNRWTASGSYGVNGVSNNAIQNSSGNYNLDFQKSHDINVGFDLEVLNKSLTISAGYFNNTLTGGFANQTDITSGITGKGGALMTTNYKKYRASGVEAEVTFRRQVGQVSMQIGLNATYGKQQNLIDAVPAYGPGYEGLNKVHSTGDIRGHRIIGIFKDQEEINNSPRQAYGAVLPGDLKYADTNGDNTVDDRDRTILGNNTPSLQYGINLSFEYKGFNLDILGYGLADCDIVLDNKYYMNYGERKYSKALVDGLPNGRPHPILRAEYSANNFLTSDYWIVNGGFFKLRNVELGYTFPATMTQKIGLNKVKVFARGFNLFTISKIKDLDPESIDAGVGNFPLGTTLTGGVSFSF